VSLKDLFAATKPGSGHSPVLGVVQRSSEFMRISALPRRELDLEAIEDVTPVFAKSGDLSFRPIQSAALIEAARADGLFAPIGVGWGKSLIGLALPEAFGAKNAVYLVPPDLKRQLTREAHSFYGKHFNLPLDRITIVSYGELSDARTARILEDGDFDAAICDEAHYLRYTESARTKRFMRFAKEHPCCKFAFMSGTMTTRSIKDYAHLIELALRKNSPVPRGYREINNWAAAIDVKPDYRMAPGILRKLCNEGESVREGYKRRMVDTLGVVATEEGSIGTSLVFNQVVIPVPDTIKKLIKQVKKTWTIGDEELTTAVEKARVLKQLASGFWYRWVWPGGEPDHEWLEARGNWTREVRSKLSHATEGLDSPFLLAQAAERYRVWVEQGRPRKDASYYHKIWEATDPNYKQELYDRSHDHYFHELFTAEFGEEPDEGHVPCGFDFPDRKDLPDEGYFAEVAYEKWLERQKNKKEWDSLYWSQWRQLKHKKDPPKEAVWEHDFVVDYAIEWAAKQQEPAIIWYQSVALGEKIAERGNFPLLGAGTDASERKEAVIVASIQTQGTGKNLQHYSRNLITELPPNGTRVEQLAGRTHRPGNKADEVIVDWLGHTDELEDAMDKAIEDAEYMQETTGQRQKLLYATKTSDKEKEK
jgi:hypothetical protein